MTVLDQWDRTRWRLYAPVYDWVAKPFERGRARGPSTGIWGGDLTTLYLQAKKGTDNEYIVEQDDRSTSSVTDHRR